MDLPGYVFFGEAIPSTNLGFGGAKGNLMSTNNPVKMQRLGAGQVFNLNTWNSWWPWGLPLGASFTIQITEGRTFSTDLFFPRDLYYSLSYIDVRLLTKQDRNGQVIL